MNNNQPTKSPVSYTTTTNKNGPTLGYTSVPIIEKDGLFFKDFERTGELVPYEDWRLSPEERATDLASRLTIEEIAGLMMYSNHQLVPAEGGSWTLGMECRHGAMERLGKDDIQNKINEIDAERSKHPELFNPLLQQTLFQSQLNSGMTNGQTPIEQVRTEMTGQNGGATL